ncbi:hypothetical protein CsSME_00001726 [Camellia sinensis var. sinensis]
MERPNGGLSDASKYIRYCKCGLSEERKYMYFALTFIIYYIYFLQVKGAIMHTVHLAFMSEYVSCGPSDVRYYMEWRDFFNCGSSEGRSYTECLLFLLLYDYLYWFGNSCLSYFEQVYSMVCRGGGCFLCRSRRQFEECICNVVTTASSAFLCYMKVIINCLFHCVYIVLLCNFAYPYGLCRRFFVPVVMLYYRQPNKDDTMGLFWFSRKVPGRTLFLNVKGIGAYSYRLCRKDPRMLGTFGFVLFKGGCYLFLLYKDPIHYRTWPLYNPMASNHPLIPDLWM